MEEDACNSRPTLLIIGAFIMLNASKPGSQHKPLGTLVQQGRSCSVKYLKLLKASIDGTIIQNLVATDQSILQHVYVVCRVEGRASPAPLPQHASAAHPLIPCTIATPI